MSQKIETTISADNSKFVQAISGATKAANDAANTLSDVAKNANEAGKAITDTAQHLESTADSAQKAAEGLEAAADATAKLEESASKATEALTITIDGMDAAEKKQKTSPRLQPRTPRNLRTRRKQSRLFKTP